MKNIVIVQPCKMIVQDDRGSLLTKGSLYNHFAWLNYYNLPIISTDLLQVMLYLERNPDKERNAHVGKAPRCL